MCPIGLERCRFPHYWLNVSDLTTLSPRRAEMGAAFARLIWPVALIAALSCSSGFAAQSSSGRPVKADAGDKTAIDQTIKINVFLLEDMEKNPDEVLESRGSRYTYFNSRRLKTSTRPLSEPKPRYPGGKQAERGGAVLLQLLINERGGLDYIDVICSAPAFEQSAVDSVRGIRFTPARDKHGPVKSYMWVEFAYGRGFPCASVPN